MADQAAIDDPRTRMDQSSMSGAQIVAIFVLGALAALDGYDVLSVTFAAPGITAEWGIDRAALGIVFSMGLLGMALGSLFLAPFADRFGRKPLILLNLGAMCLGMAASPFSSSVLELSFWRVITGIGIGAMISVLVPMTAEYSNQRHRALAVAIVTLGFPLGGVVGGSIAALLLQTFDWRAVFWLGAAAAALLVPVILVWAPESIAFLLTQRGDRALARVNRVLARCRQPELSRMPEARREHSSRASIFGARTILRTLHVTMMNFLFVITVYYMLSWIPQMTADAGFSASEAATVSVITNLCGIGGGALVGVAAPYVGIKRLGVMAFVGLSIATAAFGLTPANLDLLRLAGGVVGFCIFAGMVAIYTIIARSFPPETRATGAGFVVGLGRGGSALAPLAAGFLFASGVGRDGVSFVMGSLALGAAIVLTFLRLNDDA